MNRRVIAVSFALQSLLLLTPAESAARKDEYTVRLVFKGISAWVPADDTKNPARMTALIPDLSDPGKLPRFGCYVQKHKAELLVPAVIAPNNDDWTPTMRCGQHVRDMKSHEIKGEELAIAFQDGKSGVSTVREMQQPVEQIVWNPQQEYRWAFDYVASVVRPFLDPPHIDRRWLVEDRAGLAGRMVFGLDQEPEVSVFAADLIADEGDGSKPNEVKAQPFRFDPDVVEAPFAAANAVVVEFNLPVGAKASLVRRSFGARHWTPLLELQGVASQTLTLDVLNGPVACEALEVKCDGLSVAYRDFYAYYNLFEAADLVALPVKPPFPYEDSGGPVKPNLCSPTGFRPPKP